MEQARPKSLSDLAILGRALVGFAVATLVMLGVGGTVYNLAAPGGWLAGVFGRNLAVGMAAALPFLAIGACLWLAREWIPVRARNRSSELFVYGFAAAGVLYFVELILKGGF
jgi:hypothetical protein